MITKNFTTKRTAVFQRNDSPFVVQTRAWEGRAVAATHGVLKVWGLCHNPRLRSLGRATQTKKTTAKDNGESALALSPFHV